METKHGLKIIVVDSHPIIVKGLVSLIEEHKQFEVIGIATDGKELRELLKIQTPDVIILDLKLTKTNIYRLIKDIVIIYPKIKLVAFTDFTIPKLIQDVMEFGVNAYQVKTASLENIIEAIERAYRGENFICKSVYHEKGNTKNDKDSLKLDSKDNFEKVASLTERELDVIILLSRGLTNKGIAEKLYLSKYTIETHRKNLMKKLNLKTTGQLIYFASQQGLV